MSYNIISFHFHIYHLLPSLSFTANLESVSYNIISFYFHIYHLLPSLSFTANLESVSYNIISEIKILFYFFYMIVKILFYLILSSHYGERFWFLFALSGQAFSSFLRSPFILFFSRILILFSLLFSFPFFSQFILIFLCFLS